MPTDKGQDRVLRNCISAIAMLGQLCALYDRGVFEAGRLMSNLLYQLTIKGRSNSPLLEQVGCFSSLRIIVDEVALSTHMTANSAMSPLVSLMFGLKADTSGALRPVAMWLPPARRPPPFGGFVALSVDEWLDEQVIPTGVKAMSRRDLIKVVRDQDGGAHSDPDSKLAKSPDYIELVNAFPISKQSELKIPGHATAVWDLLPPVTMPILRQIAHEMLSAIWSQSDIGERVYLPSLICKFEDARLQEAFVPEGYPDIGPIYGKQPTVIWRRK